MVSPRGTRAVTGDLEIWMNVGSRRPVTSTRVVEKTVAYGLGTGIEARSRPKSLPDADG